MAVATNQVIEIPYKPRPLWEKVLHPALDQYRFSVLVCHRRFGKTVGTIAQCIKRALTMTKYRSPNYAYIAPFLKQAKMIAWEYLKFYTAVIPGRKINESELYVEFPSFHKDARGARIYIIGADRPDGLRGTYWDGVIIDEYAQIKPELWGEVLRPALGDRSGWAIFVGTPKGQNQFYDIYLEAEKRDDWFTALYTADDSGIIPKKELEAMKREMNDAEIQQELYCNFTVNAYNKMVDLKLINEAMTKEIREEDYVKSPKVMGVDVARFGDDNCAITLRQGLMVFPILTYADVDNMTFAGIVASQIESFNPDTVFIDSGRGEGVIDRLRQLGYNDKIIEVPFGGKAIKDEVYFNKRAEMWHGCQLWLESGGVLPYDPDLRKELSEPEFSYDAQNRYKLESKERIKDRVGKSPDKADSLCLTFAFPVTMSRSFMYRRARRLGAIRKYGSL